MSRTIGKNVLRGAAIIIAVRLLAKLTSFVVEAVLAAYLGTTYMSDAYYMVSGVQAVIYPMMSVGIWKVFLPLYKGHLTRGEDELAASLTNKALTFFTLISASVALLLLVLAPAAVSLVAPGFEGETRDLCIRLVRISSPMYVFTIASGVVASILQSHNKFLGSQIREVASHIPTIIAAVFFFKALGTEDGGNIEVMAVALVASSLFRLLVMLPFVNWGYRYRPDFGFRSKEFALMLRRLPSALMSSGVAHLNTLVDKMMASTLPEGTISALNYGHKLLNVFSGMLSQAVSTAMYPQMIELITLRKEKELGRLVVRILNIFCLLMVPVSLACALFRTELVAAVFQHGAFTAASTEVTADVFALYSISLFFAASSTVLSNIFYGYGNTRTPMFISIANLVVNVGLNFALIALMGVNGLALATSLSAVIAFFVRLRLSEKHVKLDNRALLVTALKVLLASAIACMIPRALFWAVHASRYVVLAVSAVLGIAVYIVLIRLLKVREMHELVALAKKKLRRRGAKPAKTEDGEKTGEDPDASAEPDAFVKPDDGGTGEEG